MRTHDEKWLRANAMFACQNYWCATEVSYPANMLALLDGKPICEHCYEAQAKVDDPQFYDLPKFQPFADRS